MRMAGETKDDKRSFFGPRPVSALVPALVRPAFRSRTAATAQVLADWELIVGPAIAAVSTPRKLFSGTLAIACSGPMAMELQHLSGELIARINSHLGRVTVTRLRFTQDHPVPTTLPKPRPRAFAAARLAVAGVTDPELHDALERLGQSVLARRQA